MVSRSSTSCCRRRVWRATTATSSRRRSSEQVVPPQLEGLEHPAHRREGGPQLVRGHRQELVLGPVGLLELLALPVLRDQDGGEVGRALQQLQLVRRRPADSPGVGGEGGQHAAVHVQDRDRPARLPSEAQRQVTPLAPRRVGGDVLGHDRPPQVGGRTARPPAGPMRSPSIAAGEGLGHAGGRPVPQHLPVQQQHGARRVGLALADQATQVVEELVQLAAPRGLGQDRRLPRQQLAGRVRRYRERERLVRVPDAPGCPSLCRPSDTLSPDVPLDRTPASPT